MKTVTPTAARTAEFTVHVTGLDADSFDVVRFTATEALSELFEVQLELSSASGRHDLARLVGREARLTCSHALGERHFHGLLKHVRVAERGRLHTRYHATLVPRLWLLSQRQDARIFQGLSTPEILAQVFERAGISGEHLELCLTRDYAPRDYCVQYRESDLNFAARLMEEEGIFFFFEHREDRHVLFLGDDPVAHSAVEAAAFRAPQMSDSADQHVLGVELGRSVRPGRATLRDFTFKAPTTDLERSADFPGSGQEGEDPNLDLEVYEYPGDYVQADLGATLARLRMEQLQVERVQLSGDSDVRRLCPGFRVELYDHPRDDLNGDWLLTRVVHQGVQQAIDGINTAADDNRYSNVLEAIPATVSFRPPLLTPKPRIFGLQTALVTGPPGEEIHVDRHGRVKLHFHWDRLNPADDTSSCWVRVSQGWAGAGFGHMALPRVGQEVIVQFLEGDPDRPLVTGRVYNGDNATPYPLPDQRTVSTLKSASSPGSSGFNELRFEDRAGAEEIYLHAQKDLTVDVLHDEARTVKHDRSATVEEGDDRLTVKTGTCYIEASKENVEVRAGTLVKVMAPQIQLHGEESILLVVGGNSWLMDQAGITIQAKTIHSQAEGPHVVVASPIKLN